MSRQEFSRCDTCGGVEKWLRHPGLCEPCTREQEKGLDYDDCYYCGLPVEDCVCDKISKNNEPDKD